MPTALRGHIFQTHAHAKPWAWHPSQLTWPPGLCGAVPMSFLTRVLKALRPAKAAAPKVAGLFAGPSTARPAGWWRDDHVEQLRNYTSWVYAAVNAVAQEV